MAAALHFYNKREAPAPTPTQPQQQQHVTRFVNETTRYENERGNGRERESKIVEESRFTCTAAVAAAIESVSLREHLLLFAVTVVVAVVAVTLQARDDAAWF